jgi:hypothetical protein
MGIKLEVHAIENDGVCSLTGKEGEVIVVSFGDGTISDSALCLKSFIQLLRLKLGQKPKKAGAQPAEPKPEAKLAQAVPAAVPTATPAGNGATK